MESRISTTRMQVAFGDCDPAQIVYYPNYFTWFDNGTHRLFEEAGVPWREIDVRLGVNAPIVDVQSRFSSPASWGDEIEIQSEVTCWGSRSFTVTHRIVHAEGGAAIAEGSEARVCVRRDPSIPGKITACEIPAEIRTAFGVD